MTLLGPHDVFPDLHLNLVGGDTATVAEALPGKFAVVLFNRGSWCPFCNAQLRGFQLAHGALEALGAGVVSLSVDDEVTTQAMIDKFKLTFPVGHSADAHKVSESRGAFVNPDSVYIQATGFVLDPEGKVIISAYSSGAIGRLTAEDTVGLIKYLKQASA